MYKVYKIESAAYYHGFSLVAAENDEEANLIITKFQEDDPNNLRDSRGYENVNEEADLIDGVFAARKGILHFGIYYSG